MASDPAVAIAEGLGRRVLASRRVTGGDIATAWRVDTDDGPLLIKTRADAGPRDFAVEAAGLAWLAEAEALRIPEVVGHGPKPLPWLALRFIESAPPALDHDARLGRGLAALHRAGAPCFGLDHDNLVGSVAQSNDPCDDWASFYAERRLRPLATRAERLGHLGPDARREIEAVAQRLPVLVGPAEPPARLHGDLWAGNAIVDEAGEPVLIDPAVYGGHREIDLAMMRLFGGFSPGVFSAYDEAHPLADGWRDRVALYQLYPLLVHVVLFGASYVPQLRRAARQVL